MLAIPMTLSDLQGFSPIAGLLNEIVMPSLLNSVSDFFRLSFRLFVRSFVQTDLVTTISHEWLKQSRLS